MRGYSPDRYGTWSYDTRMSWYSSRIILVTAALVRELSGCAGAGRTFVRVAWSAHGGTHLQSGRQPPLLQRPRGTYVGNFVSRPQNL